VIYIHASVSEGRRAAIARFGAEVIRVPGTYDDCVRHSAAEAKQHGWFVISDTSYEGYTDIPRDVMHGYTVMADEVIAQLPAGEAPTHVFVQAGVGGLAAAMCARFWQAWGAKRPRFVVVEPDKADCHFQSAVHGKPTVVTGDLETVMAGLACGEVSLIAWRVLDRGGDAFITIPDECALATVRLLANGEHGDTPLVAGETGVASLAGLIAAASDPAARAKLGLGRGSCVLTFGSEGDTDPEIYRRIVGRSAEEVAPA
jgi:diaminopropionate ammonia-lyase